MREAFEAALKTALDLLRASDKFRAEISGRLQSKSFGESTIAEVFAWLDSKRLADDARTLSAVASGLLNQKLLGENAVRARLLQRGAPKELVEIYFATRSGEEERQAIRAFVARKSRSSSSRVTVCRALLSRGFQEELVYSELDRHFGEDCAHEEESLSE